MSVLLDAMAKDGPRFNNGTDTARSRGLPALVRSLALDGEWPSLQAVMLEARAAGLSLPEAHELVRAMGVTISSMPAPDREAMADEIRAAKRQAASLILDRVSPAPLTAPERGALLTAGELLTDLGVFPEAAAAFERAGDDRQAAKAWGAAGEIERMEACLAREDGRASQRRAMRELVSRFETLLAGGQRLAAVDMVAAIPLATSDHPELGDLRARAAEVERRLCRGRTLALRSLDGAVVHFATIPALLGRDGFCQLVLRDAGVSRRHARVVADDAAFLVEDAGGRAGTWLCGAKISGRAPLPAQGQLALGEGCRLDFAVRAATLLEVTGVGGLDRGLRAFLGRGALPLAAAFPALGSLHVFPEERSARITCVEPVRLGGRLAGPQLELLHGDVIETAALRLEVV